MNGRLLLSRYWLLVPLILIAIVARNFVERPETFVIEETVDMRRSEADYYLEDFTTRRFDATGALEYVVAGDSLSHFPDGDVSEVIAPRVELRRPGAVWRVNAERGRFESDPDVFTLLGEVRLERFVIDAGAGASPDGIAPGEASAEGTAADRPATDAAPPDERASADVPPGIGAPLDGPLTITTRDLALALDEDTVSTDAPFEIVANGWRLAGTGLRSTIDAGKLELLSNVNGTYDAAVPP